MNLKKLRDKHKMTQKQFAALIGYNTVYYSNLERGVYPVTERTKKLVLEALRNYNKAFK